MLGTLASLQIIQLIVSAGGRGAPQTGVIGGGVAGAVGLELALVVGGAGSGGAHAEDAGDFLADACFFEDLGDAGEADDEEAAGHLGGGPEDERGEGPDGVCGAAVRDGCGEAEGGRDAGPDDFFS